MLNESEHLLVCQGEEGAETSQICDKALRFGLDDRNVLNPTGPTNRERLIEEMNDFMGVASLLVDAGIVPPDWQDAGKQQAKRDKVRTFMDYAVSKGTLQPNRK